MHKLRWKSVCFVIISVAVSTILAKNEDKSIEISDSAESIPTSSSEVIIGPPDSHEAMNNRQFSPNTSMRRKKRSYEFLMGLVNNNSKYEVTKVDPSTLSTSNKRTSFSMKRQAKEHQEDKKASSPDKKLKGINKLSSFKNNGIRATETLLELMVRIAAHPDQWEQVHKLLEKIDDDLIASKLIVNNLDKPLEESKGNNVLDNNWPHFDYDKEKKVSNNLPLDNDKSNFKYPWPSSNNGINNISNKSNKSYPKTFSYHRVTGKPIYLNKNPKAYIAVSVIAPKSMHSHQSQEDEDLILENELEQLKPWNHQQNLKNMEDVQSKWSIKQEEKAQQKRTTTVF